MLCYRFPSTIYRSGDVVVCLYDVDIKTIISLNVNDRTAFAKFDHVQVFRQTSDRWRWWPWQQHWQTMAMIIITMKITIIKRKRGWRFSSRLILHSTENDSLMKKNYLEIRVPIWLIQPSTDSSSTFEWLLCYDNSFQIMRPNIEKSPYHLHLSENISVSMTHIGRSHVTVIHSTNHW